MRTMKITTEAKNELEWWIKNVHHSVRKISHGKPNFVLRTDMHLAVVGELNLMVQPLVVDGMNMNCLYTLMNRNC